MQQRNGSSHELAGLRDWIGRRQSTKDMIAPAAVAAMAATLDHPVAPQPGEPLPAGWHWLFFNRAARASELGPDGHPKRGGFLPPAPLPWRMWAGGRLVPHAPLLVGDAARRESEIANIEVKQGRSGPLVFVLVKHRVFGAAGLAIEEEHDIVYRGHPDPTAPSKSEAAPADGVWKRKIVPDPMLLFRYSALTFNGHRIHYDHPYATQVEGYPGLVVHGPLIATLLLDLLRQEMRKARLGKFSYRAVSPLFDTAPFIVNGAPAPDGRRARVWAAGPSGQLAMSATAEMEIQE